MNRQWEKHLISNSATILQALERLNDLGSNLTLFIVDEHNTLHGSLTDGDIRRALIRNVTVAERVDAIMNKDCSYLVNKNIDFVVLQTLRNRQIKLLPIVDEQKRICRLLNLEKVRSVIPVDAVIMAGGEGRRLKPLTDSIPKPLLPVGDKPIIEHNVDRLDSFGVENIYITVKYLGEQIEHYFKNGRERNISIKFVREDEPLGTLGACSLIKDFRHEYVLVMNSDLLTDINYEDFFIEFIRSGADMAVATIPYVINVPYAVLETQDNFVQTFKEKPTYTYYSNAGIYLVRKELLENLPYNSFFNATDLMDDLIGQNKKVLSYPLLGYWLDIGKHEDYKKAQEDIKHISV
ncbi:nucleotidyltransferase family protein [uncultured Chitinophaga sp.]|uniref:nucleotidyltransferase family protein n=1 Tax=uncultured Chitinophaga sp. TaxID=339340 RepID=UPI0025E6AD68|nr:nucleotidyltransferase family protein [uncultured Chitinophaga sp.]